MGILLFFAVVQVVTVGLVSAGCPEVCVCAGPPSCPPGVSSVPDGCGCCKVCAAQLNQDCQEGRRPCDHHKGLECNYGNDVGRTHGICRAKAEGRSCEYNGRIYQNGENFSAGSSRCPDSAASKSTATKDPPSNPPVYPPYPFIPYPAYPFPKPYPKPFRKLYPYKLKKEKDTLGNELMEVGRKWDNNNNNKLRGNKHLAAWRQVGDQCAVQTTSWSQCSRSCGMGVSSRVTNDNARCKLIKETRLCNVRPCSSMSVPVKMRNKGRKCSRTHKAPEPHRLSYAGCRSSRLYRPNYCGVCRDGRCCSPRRTRTASVSFACPDGERFNRSVMFIQSCKCSDECNHLNEAAMPPQRWLYGDTHKFID
ncbi:hypothetical protein CgunFtcFv8_008966 [Champsocephalus gunnari]|uniref:Uncharacterized protein n=1 Tax=Champsocephalus gunnari TaxID=52237 RepID=A0AAN8D4V7_CHAGU|nr:hypothetical protein CgunFtcFv8_008966 [Champsocephalus gunnari]